MKNAPTIGTVFGTNDKPIRYEILNIEGDTLQCRYFNTNANTNGYCEMNMDYYKRAFAENERFVCENG